MAIQKLNLVANDRLPSLLIALMDSVTNNPVDLTASTVAVNFRFREAGNEVKSIFDVSCTKKSPGTLGQVVLDWPVDSLKDLEGDYEAEIYITKSGLVHTVFKLLKFNIRKDFPAVS